MIEGKVIIDMLMDKYRIYDREKLIEKILEKLRDRSIREQLNLQRIGKVFVVELKSSKATMFPVRVGLEVLLDIDREKEWLEDIGHELAHTFFYDLSQDFPRHLTGWQDQAEEKFCDDFAIRWAELNKSKFEPILKKWKERESE